MAKTHPKHRIKELFEELVGNTSELKAEFLDTYNMSYWVLDNYLSGRKVTLDAKHAAHFLQFFNKHKHPRANTYVLNDMYAKSPTEGISERIGLTK